jgi:hypothetical protein
MKANNSTALNVKRRNFIKAGTLLSAALPLHSAFSNTTNPKPQNALLLLSRELENLAEPSLFFDLNKTQILTLDTDLVYLWRDKLSQEVFENSKTLYGVTNWADFLLLQGLANEFNLFESPGSNLEISSSKLTLPTKPGNNNPAFISWEICIKG